MTTSNTKPQLRALAIRGTVLGVSVYRGFAKLNELAQISKADTYDKHTNPFGTQRNLDKKHAEDAYNYVQTHDVAFWPEVFLCVRDPNVIRFRPLKANKSIGILEINLQAEDDGNRVEISRVDGNHRLHLADGKLPNFPPIEKTVSFCMAYDLALDQKITLFKDININQRKMNTSHLDKIEVQLTPEETLKKKNPSLYIADKLGRDPKSPFHNRLYEGGKKHAGSDVPLRALSTGIKLMLPRSIMLQRVPDADAQYKLIRNYFQAVKKWQPNAWINPRKYLLLRGAGLWAICYIGAFIIDTTLHDNKLDADSMLKLLIKGKKWDWSNSGDFKGVGGLAGAQTISKDVTVQIGKEDNSVLFARIMEQE